MTKNEKRINGNKEKLIKRIKIQTEYIEELEKRIQTFKNYSERILNDELFIEIFEMCKRYKTEGYKDREILEKVESFLKSHGINYKIKSGRIVLLI